MNLKQCNTLFNKPDKDELPLEQTILYGSIIHELSYLTIVLCVFMPFVAGTDNYMKGY